MRAGNQRLNCRVADTPEFDETLSLLFRRGGLRLFGILGPGWNDANDSGINDRLTQMLGGMANDKQQDAALGILAAKPVQAFVEIGIRHGFDRSFRVSEGIF
jgi:hypothetical protein